MILAIWFGSVMALNYIWTSFFKVWTPITLPATQFVSGGVTSGSYTSGGTLMMQIGEWGKIIAYLPLVDSGDNAFLTGGAISWMFVTLANSWVYFNINSWTYFETNSWVYFNTYSGDYFDLHIVPYMTGVRSTGIIYPGNSNIPSEEQIITYLESYLTGYGDILTTGGVYYSANGTIASGDLRTNLSGNTLSFDYYTSARGQINYFNALGFYGPMYDSAWTSYITWYTETDPVFMANSWSFVATADVVDTMTAPWTSWEIVTSKAVALYINDLAWDLWDILTTWAYIASGTSEKWRSIVSGYTYSFQYWPSWTQAVYLSGAGLYGNLFDLGGNTYVTGTVSDVITRPGTTGQIATTKAVVDYIDTYVTATGPVTASEYILTWGFIPFRFAYSWASVEAQFYTGGAWVTSTIYTLP